ncbi:hypothetical protein T310_5019 [Rasamsonia emersonii CBS 393.64]|uniref:Uncharacterized protein n=1 Tax=Rasamsonia emersonii (strain ATCC 16479 / CBS 393.64 / IMI 116815) TaxID=1408163 RepID=A0A0F4YRR1_RASE3|nr:hypothetical protein T310_5019 [Rasamsonia emersonii CBS 393.64]KKA20934.1 hypothetical protein T310_5019 [Rasamsonia emersonii CBS 393.64]
MENAVTIPSQGGQHGHGPLAVFTLEIELSTGDGLCVAIRERALSTIATVSLQSLQTRRPSTCHTTVHCQYDTIQDGYQICDMHEHLLGSEIILTT